MASVADTLWKLSGFRPMSIHSPLPKDECVRRLRQALDPDRLASLDQPVTGMTNGDWGRARKRIAYRNSFQTVVYFKVVEARGGTDFHGWSGLGLSNYVFFAVWVGLPSLLFGRSWSGLLVIAGMVVAAVLLTALGRVLASGESDFIERFVTKLIEGTVMPSATK